MISMSRSRINHHKIIEVKTSKGYKLIDSKNIVLIEAKGKFTIVYLTDQSQIITFHMLKWYTNQLSEPLFFRCHNSYTINSSYVDCYTSKVIVMNNGSRVPLARNKLSSLKENLKSFLDLRANS